VSFEKAALVSSRVLGLSEEQLITCHVVATVRLDKDMSRGQ